MSYKDMVPVTKHSFGLYTLDAAAEYLGVSYTTVVDGVRKGYLPEKYANKLLDMGSLVMLPIDEPPPIRVIGSFAHGALKALIRGEFIPAIAAASFGLQPKPMDWETASPVVPTPLQRFCCELAHGLAWSKNQHASELHDGLPALRKLHQRVRRHIARSGINHLHPEWQAWKYLSAMTMGAALCYFVMLLGHGWFCSEKQADRLRGDPDYRRQLALRLVSNPEDLQDVKPMFGSQRHITVRVAWNMLQLSALAQSEDAFLESLAVLYGKLYQTFPAVLAALQDDVDTSAMLKLPKVAAFLRQKGEPAAA